jgi:hypothetical protein
VLKLTLSSFFKQPLCDINVVNAAEANKQAFAILEVITLGPVSCHWSQTSPVLRWYGKIKILILRISYWHLWYEQVITGEYDFIFCTGYCGRILVPGAQKIFPDSKDLEVYTQPGSGHAINLSVCANAISLEKFAYRTLAERNRRFRSHCRILATKGF